MPRRVKPDDPDWVDLSANQKRQIKAAMRQISKTRDIVYPIPDDPTPADIQVKYLRAHHENGGPHINFENSFIAKVASEVFQIAARRKLN
jgi:hypothetical protein